MRANVIKLYDLQAVNTTIVLQEIPPNPDVQNIFLYDLEAVNTTIVLRYFGELIAGGGTNWTLNLSDTITLSENIIKGVGKFLSDTVTLSDSLSGGTGGSTPQFILAYRWYWVKIYVARLEGRNVYKIKIFD